MSGTWPLVTWPSLGHQNNCKLQYSTPVTLRYAGMWPLATRPSLGHQNDSKLQYSPPVTLRYAGIWPLATSRGRHLATRIIAIKKFTTTTSDTKICRNVATGRVAVTCPAES